MNSDGTSRHPLFLTRSELDACRPLAGEGGRAWRAFCPFHESDHQRSLRVSQETGRFHCFACGAWGYLEEHRHGSFSQGVSGSPTRREFRTPARASSHMQGIGAGRLPASPRPLQDQASRGGQALPDLDVLFERYQEALPGSVGERYLAWRGIPLDLARSLGIGYASDGQWAHRGTSGRPVRQWKHGRLVFPHSDPEGRLVNFYGRAIGTDGVPRELRHDHLPGAKGYFNGMALGHGDGPVHVCEGPFDAASLMAAGALRVVAIFGVTGWRWEWFRKVRELVFAFDADEAGGKWRALAHEAVLRGRTVSFIPPASLGGCKDVNEAWMRGCLQFRSPAGGNPSSRGE